MSSRRRGHAGRVSARNDIRSTSEAGGPSRTACKCAARWQLRRKSAERSSESSDLKLARFQTPSSLPSRLYLLCRCSHQLHSADYISRSQPSRKAMAGRGAIENSPRSDCFRLSSAISCDAQVVRNGRSRETLRARDLAAFAFAGGVFRERGDCRDSESQPKEHTRQRLDPS